jgi:hypothetical protein
MTDPAALPFWQQQHDWNYLYCLIAFVVGVGAGYQGISERYGSYSGRACRFPPGLIYMFTRGLVPAAIFAGLYNYGQLKQFLWLEAAAIGTGWELFARTKFFVKQTDDNGKTEDIYKGPFDLVQFYQSLFLAKIDGYGVQDKIRFMRENLTENPNFISISNQVLLRVNGYNNQETRTKLEAGIQGLIKEFQDEIAKGTPDTTDLETKFTIKLIYSLMREVSRGETKTLIRS